MTQVRMNVPWTLAATIALALAVGSPTLAPAGPAAGALQGLPIVLAKTAPAKKTQGKPAEVKKEKKPKTPKAPKKPHEKKPPHVHTPEAGPWDQGATWTTLRAGYSRASYATAGEGNVGFGFGFSRMISPSWSFSAMAERNVLGKFNDATESEIPFTIELDRHVNWGETIRPYYGLGMGAYYHKFTDTMADGSDVRGGLLVAFGMNTAVAPRQLLGIDARAAIVTRRDGTASTNPVFGPQDKTARQWGMKLTWSVTY